MPRQFKELAVGEIFRQCLGIESGLWESDKDKAGRYIYRKVSKLELECIGYGQTLFDDENDEKLVKLSPDFIEDARINRSGRIGSGDMKVWP